MTTLPLAISSRKFLIPFFPVYLALQKSCWSITLNISPVTLNAKVPDDLSNNKLSKKRSLNWSLPQSSPPVELRYSTNSLLNLVASISPDTSWSQVLPINCSIPLTAVTTIRSLVSVGRYAILFFSIPSLPPSNKYS